MIKNKKKSQVSLEYLIILALSLMLIIPLITFVYRSTNESAVSANTQMILNSGKDIISTSENIYYQGKGSKMLLNLNFPSNIENITVLNGNVSNNIPSEIVFNTIIKGENVEFVFFSSVNIYFNDPNPAKPCNNQKENLSSDDVTGGLNKIFIYSCGDNISMYRYLG